MSDSIEPTAIGVLSVTPDLLRSLFGAASPGALTREDSNGWTPKHVLAHVVDAEGIAFSERIRRMIDEESPFIRSIDPDARIVERGLLERSAEALVDELAGLRAANVKLVAGLSAEELARRGEHDVAGTITPSDIVHQWAYHDLMHVRQIAEMLQGALAPRMGNTRRFYDV